jgi:hypothetical protein
VHDQLNQERAAQQVFAGFHEPQPFPDFFPTYKKYENRRPLDYSDPSWVRQCYRIRYKEPFYKVRGSSHDCAMFYSCSVFIFDSSCCAGRQSEGAHAWVLRSYPVPLSPRHAGAPGARVCHC